jgi:tetratricopeptide (TPR) repeat protein
LLANLGDADQAIELTRQALATEPLRANVYYWLGTYYLGINRLDEAERATRRAIELQPGAQSFHVQLAIIEIKRGQAQLALAAAQQEPPGTWKDAALALAQQIGPDRRNPIPPLRPFHLALPGRSALSRLLPQGRSANAARSRGTHMTHVQSFNSPRNSRGRLEVLEERGVSRWWSSSQS